METIPFVHTGLHVWIYINMVSGGGVDFRTISIHQSPSLVAVDTYEVEVWHVPPLREKIIVNQWTIHMEREHKLTMEAEKSVVLKKAPKSSEAKLHLWVQRWVFVTLQWVTNGLHENHLCKASFPAVAWTEEQRQWCCKDRGRAYEQYTQVHPAQGMKNSSVLWEWSQ